MKPLNVPCSTQKVRIAREAKSVGSALEAWSMRKSPSPPFLDE